MRWLLRLGLYTVLPLLLAGGLLAAVLLERAPAVASAEGPTTADVQTAKHLLKRFRKVTQMPEPEARIALAPHEIDALIALGQRAVRGARADAALGEGEVVVRGSIPLRVVGEGPWLNVSARVPDFDGGLALSAVRVGRLDLPPDMALGLAERAVSLWLGGQAGPELIAAFPALRTTPEGVRLAVAVNGAERGEIARTLFAAFRGDRMPTAPEVDGYRRALRDAFAEGALTPDGSFAPHLAYMLERAHARGAGGDLGREYTAAIFALASACGSERVRPYLGKLLPEGGALDGAPVRGMPCGEAGLRDRVDLRRHFVTAAALRAASNRGVAVSLGEFKELSDMGGKSGFDFTDIVANNSGIRLSDRMMSAPAAEWPSLLALIPHEDNLMPPLDGVPAAMSMREFETKYHDLHSTEYAALVERIEARIDRLPLHRPRL